MKRIAICFIALILLFNIKIYATEPPAETAEPTQAPATEEVATEKQESVSSVQAEAIVTKVGEIKDVTTGSITDTYQEVTVEILNGEYETEEFTTNYNLSYDIEGKIKAYELEEGDKVNVQISKDEKGKVSVTIQEIIKTPYIFLIFGLFLLSILLVGGKQGLKAILGLIVTIIAVCFILIKGIYAGQNAILMTVITSAVIIFFTFVIIGGFSKKIVTAALRNIRRSYF